MSSYIPTLEAYGSSHTKLGRWLILRVVVFEDIVSIYLYLFHHRNIWWVGNRHYVEYFSSKMSYIGSFFVTLLLNYVHDKCVFPYVKRYIVRHHILRG